MHRMQSKINGLEDKTKWIKISLQKIWIIFDGLEGTKPVRMEKIECNWIGKMFHVMYELLTISTMLAKSETLTEKK